MRVTEEQIEIFPIHARLHDRRENVKEKELTDGFENMPIVSEFVKMLLNQMNTKTMFTAAVIWKS